jgi:membrane-associated protease RseP (regulator of RpoE activity)
LKAHAGLITQTHFVDTPTVTVVGGTIHSKLVKVPHLDLGPFHLPEVVAVVPEASSGVLSNPSVAGFIGAEILKRFTVIWDYTGKRMVLLPNRTFGEPFETDASGLHLVSPGPQYQMVEIDSALPGSPAAQAGLKPGDEILAIDEVSGLPLWKVREALRKAETSVVLSIRRKTATLRVNLPLRNPFQQAG